MKLSDGIAEAFIVALGATPIEIDFPDIYTSLERGVTDGISLTIETLVALGAHEVVSYGIDEPFFVNDITAILASLTVRATY